MRLYLGYNSNRPYLDVEVISEENIIAKDEDGNSITYEFEGEFYHEAYMEYHLGKIVFKYNC